GGTGTSRWRQLEHAPVALATRSSQFVPGKRRDDDARTDGVHSGPARAPPNRLGHDSQRVPPFGQLVGVKSVLDLVGLQHGKTEQFVGGSGGEGRIFFVRKGGQSVSRL